MITKRNDFIIYARKAGSGFVFAVVLVVEADGSDDAAAPNLEPSLPQMFQVEGSPVFLSIKYPSSRSSKP